MENATKRPFHDIVVIIWPHFCFIVTGVTRSSRAGQSSTIRHQQHSREWVHSSTAAQQGPSSRGGRRSSTIGIRTAESAAPLSEPQN